MKKIEAADARVITTILLSLVALDLILAVWGFFLPGLWFKFFHGVERVDPQALLTRCAANWLGFLIIQAGALMRWRRNPGWLLLVAGARLGDTLTDITVVAFAENISIFGAIAFPIAGVGNILIGLMLFRLHRKITG